MSKKYIEIPFDLWERKYKPIDIENGYDLWHTDKAFKEADPDCIWTAHDGDYGGTYLQSGVHYVNRFGFALTEIPCEKDLDIQVYDTASYEGEQESLRERLSTETDPEERKGIIMNIVELKKLVRFYEKHELEAMGEDGFFNRGES